MTKKFTISYIVIVCLFLLSSCFLGQAVPLSAPDVTLSEDGSYIEWEAVPNAVHYEVTVNSNKEIVRDSTTYYFTTGGNNMTVTVKAIGDGIVFQNSETVSITGNFSVALATPTITLYRVVEDLHIEWLEIEDADSYVIDINGSESTLPSTQTSYVYPLPDVGTYIVGVKAMAPDLGFYVNSVRVEKTFVYTIPTPAALAQGESATKTFDKANSIDVEFLININDDTTYILTGEGATSSDYTYNGTVLTVKNSFLLTLSIGVNNFVFETEQSTINLTININDSRSPQLVSSGVNFNLEEVDNPDVEITLLLNSATLTTVEVNDVLQVVDVDYTYSNSKVVFDAVDVYLWSVGTYQVKLTLNSASTVHTLLFTISVIDTTEPYSDQTSITYNKGNPVNVEFNLTLNAASFDTLQGNLTSSDWSYSGSKLIIKSDYLYSLDLGVHHFVVYTSLNAFAINVEVINNSNNCYNVRIDTDSAYPSILLRWDYDGSAIDFYYSINGGGAVQVTGSNYVALSTVTRSSTFTFKVRPATGTYSQEKTYSPDSVGIPYLSQSYTFMGDTYDRYIGSQEELNNFIYYACFDRSTATMSGTLPNGDPNLYGYKVMPEVFIGFDYGEQFGGAGGALSIALNSVPLKGSFSVAYPSSFNGSASFTIIYNSEGEPSLDKVLENTAIQQDFYPSHINELKGTSVRPSGWDNFAINSITKTQGVRTSEELFNVVQAGVRPLPVSGSTAESIYNEAKSILRTNITSDMSEIDKLHAIYDWIIFNVQYDKAVLTIYNNTSHPDYPNLNKYNCFYLEGVFDDGVAVCDGFAKAFVLLARIEGIEAIKVSGVSHGINHAWNKVKLGYNWYTIDSTWGNITVTAGDKEYLTHAYFMVSDVDLYSSHRESAPAPASHVSYGYYENTYYDTAKNLYIETQQQFNDLINFYVDNPNPWYLEFYNASGLNYNTLISNSGVSGWNPGSPIIYTIDNVIIMGFNHS